MDDMDREERLFRSMTEVGIRMWLAEQARNPERYDRIQRQAMADLRKRAKALDVAAAARKRKG